MGTNNIVFLENLEWFDDTGKELVHRLPQNWKPYSKPGQFYDTPKRPFPNTPGYNYKTEKLSAGLYTIHWTTSWVYPFRVSS